MRLVSHGVDVEENAAAQMQHLHTKTMEQIAKEEEQTARISLSPWEQVTLRIQDEWQDKVRAIKNDEDDQLAHIKNNATAAAMVEQDANAKRTAAHQLMVAEMIQSEQEMRDKLASGLQQLFSNPAQFFEKRAMDTAFQLMANEMLSTFKGSTPAGGIMQYMFGMGPEMSTSTNPLHALGSAFGVGSGSSSISPSMIQFQQGSTVLLTGSQALLTASASLQSAAGSLAFSSGTSGVGSLGGVSLPGMGGAGAASGGGSADIGSMAASNPMMMPGLGASTSTLSTSTWDNSMMMPGLNGIAAESTLGTGGAATGAKGFAGAAGIASGALMAGTSIYSAYQNSDPLSGVLGGALGGMEMGAAIGSFVGPLGTVIGGAIGAVAGAASGLTAGLLGDKGRGQAQGLDANTIQPTLAKDMQDYEAGRSGYTSISTELNSLLISAQNSTQQMGSGARFYFNNTIQPEIYAVLASLQKQEIGGRSALSLSAAQYHTGGWIDDFGDLGTGGSEGFIHAMQKEFVVNPVAAAAHAPILQAMNSGTNFAYSQAVQPRMPSSSGGGGSVTLNIQAIDSKSVAHWAKSGGALDLIAAINQGQRQYSGMGRG